MRRPIQGLQDPKPVTLKDIADHLGVSVTTVARSLKDGHKIGPEMVQRVRQAADRLGYVRNLDGVKLRTGKTLTILAQFAFPQEEEVGDAGALGLLAGIHSRLADTDYTVRVVPAVIGENNLKAVVDVVRSRIADGVILDHIQPQDDRVKLLLEYGIPFVTYGRTELLTQHAYFDIDNEFAAWQGTSAMIGQGHRRIALVDLDPAFSFVQQRLRGYRRALQEAGLPFDPALVAHVQPDPAAAREAAQRLTSADNPDAFVCTNETVYLGVRAGVRSAAAGHSQRVGFSVRTGTNIGAYLGSRMTASHYSRIRSGYQLAELLLQRLDGRPADELQVLARTELREPS
ncbi:LacI family DNA-binding transcriptional regulator [Chthonobacter albigriseus]|uniref:LacI family DNA-binding transcriptional regulator n=1 Tax=Chthonobacter albigriseus TaxID=1683161 RepID=UPI0015EFB6DF|nr:LacI family DNA-binding transcriptional regulator [Chthonobacter albigriseus]